MGDRKKGERSKGPRIGFLDGHSVAVQPVAKAGLSNLLPIAAETVLALL